MAAPVAVEEPIVPEDAPHPHAPAGRRVTRVVSGTGPVSLATHLYHVGEYLAGETVEVVLQEDALLEIFHQGVLVQALAQRHQKEVKTTIPARSSSRPRLTPPPLPEGADTRLVDPAGPVSLAGTGHRVAKAHCDGDHHEDDEDDHE